MTKTVAKKKYFSLLSAELWRAVSWYLCLLVLVAIPGLFWTAENNIFELTKSVAFKSLVTLALGSYVWAWWLSGSSIKFKVRQALPWVLFPSAQVVATIASPFPLLSWTGNYYRGMGLIFVLYHLVFAGLLVAYVKSARHWRELVWAFGLGALVPVGYALLQFTGHDPFAWQDMAFGRRLFATLGQPNGLGLYLAMVLPWSLLFVINTRNPVKRLFPAALTLIVAGVLLATQSRAAVLAMMTGVACFLTLTVPWKRMRLQRSTWVVTGLLAVGFALLGWTARDQLTVFFRLSSATTSTRLTIQQGAVEAIMRRPITGYGLDSMQPTFGPYYRSAIALTEGPAVMPDRAHNLLIDLLYSSGILGLLAWLILVGSVFWRWSRTLGAMTVETRRLSIAALGSLAAYLVGMQFSVPTVTTEIYFWTMLAVLWVVAHWKTLPQTQATDAKTGLGRHVFLNLAVAGLLIVLTAAGLFYQVRTFMADSALRKSQVARANQNFDIALDHLAQARELTPGQTYYTYELVYTLLEYADRTDERVRAEQLVSHAQKILREVPSEEQKSLTYARLKAQIEGRLALWEGSEQALQQASDLYRAAVMMAPQKADLYDEWGLFLLQSGVCVDASHQFARALELFDHPQWRDTFDYRVHLAYAKWCLGDTAGAGDTLRKARALGSMGFDSDEARWLEKYLAQP